MIDLPKIDQISHLVQLNFDINIEKNKERSDRRHIWQIKYKNVFFVQL